MPHRKTRFVSLAVVIVLGAAVVAAAQPRTVQVTGGAAEIRATANPRAAVVLRAPEGTVLEVLDREFDWYRVAIPPGLRPTATAPASGYISVHQVQPVADPAAGLKPRGAPATPGQPGSRPPAAPRGPMRVRVFGTFLFEQFQAANSFEAIYGSASAPIVGGGLDVSFARRFFVQADVSYVKRTGERAFVFNNEVFPLGISQQMTLTPIGLTLGYRRAGARRLTPYAGGGVLVAFYREESELAGDENVSKTSVGGHGMAGAEIRLARLFSTAVEGGYRYIPGIIGEDGVSKEFGEKNLGGFTVGVKVLIGR